MENKRHEKQAKEEQIKQIPKKIGTAFHEMLRSHFARHGRKIKISTIAIIVLALLFALLILFLKVHFLLGEEVVFSVSPSYATVDVMQGEPFTFSADATITNNVWCTARCAYSLDDLGTAQTLDSGSFDVNNEKVFNYAKQLTVTDLGAGQKLFLYALRCNNVPSTLCQSSNASVVRKSALFVIYHPTQTQATARASVVSWMNITQWHLAAAFAASLDSGALIELNSQVQFKQVQAALDQENSTLDSLRTDIKGIFPAWDARDYSTAQSGFLTQDLLARSARAEDDSIALSEDAMATLAQHADALAAAGEARARLADLDTYLQRESSISPTDGQHALDAGIGMLASNFNSIISSFSKKSFESYAALSGDLTMLRGRIQDTNGLVIAGAQARAASFSPALFLKQALTCISTAGGAGNDNQVCVNSSMDGSLRRLTDLKALSAPTGANITLNMTFIVMDGICAESVASGAAILNATPSAPSREELLVIYSLVLRYEQQADAASVLDSALQAKLSDYKQAVLDALRTSYNMTIDTVNTRRGNSGTNGNVLTQNDMAQYLDYYPDSYNKTFATSLGVSWAPMDEDIAQEQQACADRMNISSLALADITIAPATAQDNMSKMNDLKQAAADAQILSLPPDPDMCCANGVCNACCDPGDVACKALQRPSLILLHGHSFNKDTSAYNSIGIFDPLEERLSADGSYLDLGTFSPSQNQGIPLAPGATGRAPLPVMLTPTYYLESYTNALGVQVSQDKSGTIDTYVLRLKDIIDRSVAASGNSQVDIVAHSMGGLVVRRYMQAFGSGKIRKLFLVGTPNQGIGDNAYSHCTWFGAKAECEDMHQGSLLLSTLNDPTRQPTTLPDTYLIIGHGCDTEGSKDGDGVVTEKSALLPGISADHILYVTGACSTTDPLHMWLLDPVKYPATYSYILEKLIEK